MARREEWRMIGGLVLYRMAGTIPLWPFGLIVGVVGAVIVLQTAERAARVAYQRGYIQARTEAAQRRVSETIQRFKRGRGIS